MKRYATLLASAALLACGPKPTDTHPIAGGSESQCRALAEAVRASEEVWRSPVFWDIVEQRTWIPGPGQDPITGSEVRAALESHSPVAQKYRLVAFYGRRIWTALYTTANAETAACGTVDVLRRRVPRPSLINTVAHENTHLAKLAGQCESRFVDGDYTTQELPWLVSYGLGDLVQCFASSGGDANRTSQCYEQIVGAERACRLEQQCCMGGTLANVAKARAAAPECRLDCATEIHARCAWSR
jgi:hypothetical protein